MCIDLSERELLGWHPLHLGELPVRRDVLRKRLLQYGRLRAWNRHERMRLGRPGVRGVSKRLELQQQGVRLRA
jgi:hypothetical protein